MADSILLKLLPPWFKTNPLARGIANAVGRPLDELRTAAATAYRYVDPDAAPEDALDWLMYVVALPRNDGLSARRKRNLIKVAWQTWPQKGRRDAIERWVRAIAGVNASVFNLNTVTFVAGISRAGDVCGPGVQALRYEVVVTPGSIDATILRQLLEPVVPSYCDYRIRDTTGATLSDFTL